MIATLETYSPTPGDFITDGDVSMDVISITPEDHQHFEALEEGFKEMWVMEEGAKMPSAYWYSDAEDHFEYISKTPESRIGYWHKSCDYTGQWAHVVADKPSSLDG